MRGAATAREPSILQPAFQRSITNPLRIGTDLLNLSEIERMFDNVRGRV